MLKFTYKVTINALPAYGDKQAVEELTGTLEAPDQSAAYERVKIFAWDRCQQLKTQRDGLFGYENVRVELAQEATAMTVEAIIDLIKKMIVQATENERKFVQLCYQGQAEHQEGAHIEMHHCAGQKIALQILLSEIVGNDLPFIMGNMSREKS